VAPWLHAPLVHAPDRPRTRLPPPRPLPGPKLDPGLLPRLPRLRLFLRLDLDGHPLLRPRPVPRSRSRDDPRHRRRRHPGRPGGSRAALGPGAGGGGGAGVGGGSRGDGDPGGPGVREERLAHVDWLGGGGGSGHAACHVGFEEETFGGRFGVRLGGRGEGEKEGGQDERENGGRCPLRVWKVACGEGGKCQEREDGWEDYGVVTLKSNPATTAIGSRNGGALKCGA